MTHLQGPHREVKAEYRQTDRTRGTCLYDGRWVECFRVPKVRPNWSIQTNLVGSNKVFSEGHTEGGPWGSGKRDHKRESYQELTFACDPGAVIKGTLLPEGLVFI